MVPPAADPAVPAPERLLALDVFRGMTIAGMLLVNNPGNWGAIHPPLAHARWHGWTPTDLIFPFFLFIVGVTTHLSLGARRARGDDDGTLIRQIARRSALIFLFGLLLAAFPFWPLTQFTEIRIPGVLQRIGVAYFFGALLTLRTTLKQQVLVIAALLLGYWFMMTLLPVPGQLGLGYHWLDVPSRTLAAWVDRAVLDGHLWRSTRTWDPEGVLSTIPAIGTAMLGVLAGRWIGRPLPLPERVSGLFAAGALGAVGGAIWHWAFPINKSLWTSSYVVFSAGLAALSLATVLWIIDQQRVTWWTRPFVIYGVNPMIAFVGSGIMGKAMASLIRVDYQGAPTALKSAIYKSMFEPWFAPRNASLAYAVCFVLVWLAILAVLHRRRIYLKV